MSFYRAPFHQLHIVYGTNKGKNYTEEEDRFLVGYSFSQPCVDWQDHINTIGLLYGICSQLPFKHRSNIV